MLTKGEARRSAVNLANRLHSIEEQHHQIPHQHNGQHSRYRECQCFPRFAVTFEPNNLHRPTFTKVSGDRDLGYGGDLGEGGGYGAKDKTRPDESGS